MDKQVLSSPHPHLATLMVIFRHRMGGCWECPGGTECQPRPSCWLWQAAEGQHQEGLALPAFISCGHHLLGGLEQKGTPTVWEAGYLEGRVCGPHFRQGLPASSGGRPALLGSWPQCSGRCLRDHITFSSPSFCFPRVRTHVMALRGPRIIQHNLPISRSFI